MTEVTPILSINDLSVAFGSGSRTSRILKGIDLSIYSGRTLGLVGESGSGKSTLAKTIVGTVKPTAGEIRMDGVSVERLSKRGRLAFRRSLQLIPQDPYSSLNPRFTFGQTLAEAVDPRRGRVRPNRDLIAEWLEAVSLPSDAMNQYPHEFSGGQRQRVAIARALIIQPKVVIADEITSALDVSVQAEILDLLARLKIEQKLTMMFISHNLAVVSQISDDVAVLYKGSVVEQASAASLFTSPQHHYTQALLAAVPGSPTFSLV